MIENLKIRKAEIKDAQRIAILSEQLDYPVTQEEIEQRLVKILNDNSHIIYVATLENDYVIGWAHIHICDLIIMPKQAILYGLIVEKDYRQNGIGRLLMQQIEQSATLFGCEGVILRSNIKRQEAHLFYEKIGYTNIRQQKTFKKKL